MNKTIEVVDSLMGTGKTTGIINWMRSNPHNRYLYVSPMLSEVEERVPSECPELFMLFPTTEHHKTKGKHLLELLQEGRNICITHKMFSELRKEHLEYIKEKQYVLIVDEEVEFISPFTEYSSSDFQSLIDENLIEIDYDNLGRVQWKWDIKDGHKFSKLKYLSDIGAVFVPKREMQAFLLHLPLDLITSASRVILLTYNYEGSIMHSFLTLKGITHKSFTGIRLLKDESEVKQNIKNLLKIVSTPSVDKISKSKSSLSSSWYKNSTQAQRSSLLKAMTSFKVNCKVSSDDFMFCTKKEFADNIKSRVISVDKSFVFSSCKGTNIYSHKTVLFHAYNRYPDVPVSVYLNDYGHPCDPDKFALNELIQWIWRSAIRNDKEIQVCIVSSRMRELLEKWLDDVI
jgi:hypothetical protein